MKRIENILFLVGILLMVSCLKTEEIADSLNGEICINPVVPDMTKTRAGGVGEYPEGGSFGVFAYHSDAEGGEKWSDAGAAYFENHKFKNQDGVCAGVDPVYWPLEGSLIFAGYSPYEETDMAHFDVITKTLTINDYTVDGTKDLMYFLPELSEGKYVGYDKSSAPIPVQFHHALSCVAFELLAGQGGGTVTLKKVILDSVLPSGDFSVELGQSVGTWKNTAASEELIVFDSAEGEILSTSSPLTTEAFVIPCTVPSITIVYQIDGGSEQSKTFNPDDSWNAGIRTVYSISIDAQEAVIINPSVSIQHKYSDNVLIGSQVTVDLGLTDDKLANISNLNIEVKAGSDSYKTYSAATISSNEFSFDTGNRLYLPNKDYTVVFTYNDGLEEREVSVSNVSRETPVFDLDVKVLTRPYKAWNKPAQIVGRRVSLTISDDVLAEAPADVLVQTGSSSIFDIKSLTVSSYVNDTMTPINVSNSSTVSATAKVVFDGNTITFDKSFYVASSYTRSQTPINNASELEDGCKYTISLNSSSYYWVGGSSLLSQTIPSSEYSNLDYIFIFLKDDNQKADIDIQYNYSSAGAWVLNYDWTYLNDSFKFTSTPSYFTCTSHYYRILPSDNQKIYIYHKNHPLDMLRYNNGYAWGFDTYYEYSTWYIYKLEEN